MCVCVCACVCCRCGCVWVSVGACVRARARVCVLCVCVCMISRNVTGPVIFTKLAARTVLFNDIARKQFFLCTIMGAEVAYNKSNR